MARGSSLRRLGPFAVLRFPGIPENADIYFAHAYVDGGELLLVMPISLQPPDTERSGIFVARGTLATHLNGEREFVFSEPWRLLASQTCAGRTIDVPMQGLHVNGGALELPLHRYVRNRMDAKMSKRVRPPCLPFFARAYRVPQPLRAVPLRGLACATASLSLSLCRRARLHYQNNRSRPSASSSGGGTSTRCSTNRSRGRRLTGARARRSSRISAGIA